MAVFETILKSDLSRPVQVTPLIGNFFSSDNEGNRINVDVYDHGSPATLTGGVMGYIIRADNVTVTVQGTASGNRASILLPASAYTVVGLISIVIKNGETTIGACTSYVYRTTTDTIFDPGHVIPSIDELLAKIGDCEAATDAAYDAAEAADAAVGQADMAVLAAASAVALADQAVLSTSSAVAAANLATAYANSAAAMIDGLTVVASTVIPSGAATATVSTESGHKHIAFGIPKGNPGKDFRIAKTFDSIEEMEEYTGQDIEAYDFVMIDTGSVEDPDTGKLYCYEPESSPVWHYIGDLSGKQGIKGETGNGIDSVELNADYTLSIYFTDSTSVTTSSIRGETGAVPSFSIGSVSTGAAGSSAAATITGTDLAPVLNLVIPRGDKGDSGAGIPSGGTAGQILSKSSATDYATQWVDQIGLTTSIFSDSNTKALAASAGNTLRMMMNIKADDNAVVHNTGSESTYEEITGAKWFQTRYFAVGKSSVSRYHNVYFKHDGTSSNNNGSIQLDAGNATNQTLNRIQFVEYAPKTTPDAGNTGYYEIYRLPSPTAGRTSNGDYSILTSKDPEGGRSALELGDAAQLKDCILYQAAATSHTFTVPSNSRNVIISCGDGVSRLYIAFIYGASNGAVTIDEIAKGSAVTSVTTDTNKITITKSASNSIYLRCVNLRGDPLSVPST